MTRRPQTLDGQGETSPSEVKIQVFSIGYNQITCSVFKGKNESKDYSLEMQFVVSKAGTGTRFY